MNEGAEILAEQKAIRKHLMQKQPAWKVILIETNLFWVL